MNSKIKKRIYTEDVKTRHTTHWDMDYLTHAELDNLYRKNRQNNTPGSLRLKPYFRRSFLKAVLAGSTVVLLAVLFLLYFV